MSKLSKKDFLSSEDVIEDLIKSDFLDGSNIEILMFGSQHVHDMLQTMNIGPVYTSMIGGVPCMQVTCSNVKVVAVESKLENLQEDKEFLEALRNFTVLFFVYDANEALKLLKSKKKHVLVDNIQYFLSEMMKPSIGALFLNNVKAKKLLGKDDIKETTTVYAKIFEDWNITDLAGNKLETPYGDALSPFAAFEVSHENRLGLLRPWQFVADVILQMSKTLTKDDIKFFLNVRREFRKEAKKYRDKVRQDWDWKMEQADWKRSLQNEWKNKKPRPTFFNDEDEDDSDKLGEEEDPDSSSSEEESIKEPSRRRLSDTDPPSSD